MYIQQSIADQPSPHDIYYTCTRALTQSLSASPADIYIHSASDLSPTPRIAPKYRTRSHSREAMLKCLDRCASTPHTFKFKFDHTGRFSCCHHATSWLARSDDDRFVKWASRIEPENDWSNSFPLQTLVNILSLIAQSQQLSFEQHASVKSHASSQLTKLHW